MGLYGTIIELTKKLCPRCGDTGQKTVYRKGGVPTVVCRNCGHSWRQ